MLQIRNRLWWSNTLVLFAFFFAILSIIGIYIDAAKFAILISIALLIIIACLITSYILNDKSRTDLNNIHEANCYMEMSLYNQFESLKEPLGWFQSVFTRLINLPEEKVKNLKQLGNTLPEVWLKKAILLCINNQHTDLTTGELNILRECCDKRFPPKTQDLLDHVLAFNLSEKETLNASADIIAEYYKIFGVFARVNELASGMLRSLSNKEFSSKQKLEFIIELDQYLAKIKDIDGEFINELYKELVKQNNTFN